MGILDLLFGGQQQQQPQGMLGGGLYGLQTPQQQQDMQQRGLMGFLGGMANSGALDYTVPFISGKVPGGFAKALAAGAGGQGEAMDKAALSAANAQLNALKGEDLKSKIDTKKMLFKLLGMDDSGTSTIPDTSGPSTAPPLGDPLDSGAAVQKMADMGDTGAAPAPAEAGKMLSYLVEKHGLSPAAAAGMLGNAAAESSFNPGAVGDKGTSGGLFQHHNERWDNLKQFARAQGKTWTDPFTQIDFAVQEAKSMMPQSWFQSKDPMQAAQMFQDIFERPRDDTGRLRGNHAANILRSFSPSLAATRQQVADLQPGSGNPSLAYGGTDYAAPPGSSADKQSAFDARVNIPHPALSAAYADAVGKGFKGTVQDFAQQAGAGPRDTVAPQVTGTGAPVSLAQLAGGPQQPQGAPRGMLAPPVAPQQPPGMLGTPQAAPGVGGGLRLGNLDLSNPKNVLALGALADLAGIPSLATLATGTPGYQGLIAGAKKGAEYPYEIGKMREQTGEDIRKGYALAPIDLNKIQTQADLDRVSKQLEQAGAAARDIVTVNAGGREMQVTRAQAAEMANRALGGTGGPSGTQGAGNAPATGNQAFGKPTFTPGEAKADEGIATAGIKALEDTHQAELSANKRTQLYGQMAEAMQGFKPGATADMKLRAGRVWKDLTGVDLTGVPAAEVFQQAGRQIQIAAAPKGQGSVSNYEREIFAEAIPKMTTSPEGLEQALAIGKRLDDYDRQVAQIHREVAKQNGGRPNYLEAQQRIAALGPPLSAAETAALERLKGEKGAAAPAGNAAPRRGVFNPQTNSIEWQ